MSLLKKTINHKIYSLKVIMIPKYTPEKNLTHVFKYQPINQYTYTSLKKGQLYFSNPKDFNDPFDNSIGLNLDASANEIINYFSNIKADESQKKKAIENYFSGKFKPEKVRLKLSSSLVCCFSKVNDNKLMWSHYANNHTGICLGFHISSIDGSLGLEINDNEVKIPNIPPNFIPIMKVIYEESMPEPYNPITEKRDTLRIFNFAVTKHIDWAYEKEYRLILINGFHCRKNLINFKRESFISISFGMNIDLNEKEKIKQIVRDEYSNKGIHIKLYQAKPSISNYDIELHAEN